MTTYLGDSPVLLQQKLQVIRNFSDRHGEFSVFQLDAEELKLTDLISQAGTLPFLVDEALIVVNDIASNPELAESIDKVIAAKDDRVSLIFGQSASVKKTSKVYKALKKYTDLKEASVLKGSELTKFVHDQAQARGLKLTSSQALMIIDRAGEDLNTLTNEVAKLANYDQIDDQIIKDLIDARPKAKVFDLLDLISSGNVGQSMMVYDDLKRQGEDPFKIFGLIVWQLNIFAVAKACSGESGGMSSATGISSYAYSKASAVVGRMTYEQVQGMLASALITSEQLKKHYLDPDSALCTYIADTCLLFRR